MALKRKQRLIPNGLSKEFATESAATSLTSLITGAVSKSNSNWQRGLRGYQITDSEGHPFFPKEKRPEGDIGGPFTTRSIQVVDASHRHMRGEKVSGTILYRHENGLVLPSPFDSIVNVNGVFNTANFPNYASSDSTLNALGATAISLCNPVNPIFDASTAIAELYRDGLPTITGLSALKGRNLSSIGDEFLNYQFGILPLINDIKDLGKAFKSQGAVLKQLRRDSGRLVRRSFEFPTSKSVVSDTSSAGSLSTTFPGSFYTGTNSGTTKKQVIVERSQWFSGAFTYYLPDSSEFEGIVRMGLEADKLYGVVPDIADLWNLIPWSWAVDWFVNVGPVLQNLTNWAKYGLVMPYGYMMEKTTVKYQYTFTPNSFSGPGASGCTLTIVDETKKRVKASPFGFGVTWDSFNTTQLAILAALGLSRSPF